MTEENTAIPESWSLEALGEIGSIIRGVSYKKNQARSDPAPGYLPLLRATNIDSELNFRDLVYVPENVVRPEQHLRPGDIVVAASSGSIKVVGKAAQLRKEWNGTFGAFCAVFRPYDVVEPRYLAWFMASPVYRARVSSLAAGSNINNLKREHLAETVVPLPTRREQESIAHTLDVLCARIENGQRQLRQAQRGAANYRAAVLRDALEGDWDRVPLREALVSLRNGIFVSRPKGEPPGIPIYRISAVRPMALNTSDIRFAPEELDRHEEYLVGTNDLLFTRYSGNAELVGACARVPEKAIPALHPDKLIRAAVDQTKAYPPFLELACSAGQTWSEIRGSRKTTAGQVGISGKQLAAVTIPLPPLDVQRNIAGLCHGHIQAGRALEADLEASALRAETLRESVLHHVLTGQLLLPLWGSTGSPLEARGRVASEAEMEVSSARSVSWSKS